MGIVYKGEDLTLQRPVALKFLPSSVADSGPERARLLQEAMAASAIDHPNVCTVYEVGETPEGELFLAMAMYEGETLREKVARGPLPIREALNIALQVADGLHAAHEKGVVHRDIKSENIFITAKGLVKIMDFGLARSKALSRLTSAGTTLGTLPYMSPEQASGDPVDQRTDLWSLGVVLYEMISGRLPFRSDYADALVYAILNEQPPPVTSLRSDVPLEVERIVNKMLTKAANDRYQAVPDLIVDLRSCVSTAQLLSGVQSTIRGSPPLKRFLLPAVALGVLLVLVVAAYLFFFRSPVVAAKKSIAVLPFQNLSDSRDDEYLSDGIAESINTDLARRRGLLVISRNSTFKYKGQPVDAQQVARDLSVGYVLEGSVQRSGATLRVTAQLIDASTGFQVWADRYDRDKKDLFALQDDISGRIVSALAVTVSGEERALKGKQSTNPEAYDALLRGEFYMQPSTTAAAIDSAIFHFQEAVRLDPGFARAYAELGDAYAALVFNVDPSRTNQQKAYVAIEKALALDSTLAAAYSARASLLWTRSNGFPHERALQEYRRALQFDPNSSGIHEAIGGIYFHVGLLDKAIRELRTSIAIDPLNTYSPGRIARIFWYGQQFDSALAQYGKIREQSNWAYEHAVVLHDLGRDEEALAVLRGKVGAFSDSMASDDAAVLAVISAGRGETGLAEHYIQLAYDKGHVTSHFHHGEFFIACAYALMNRPARAVEWLAKTAEDGLPCYPLFMNDPNLKSLQKDPAYLALIVKIKEQWEYYRANL
jgi:eukaryotic-like serine/threonine-protein kinase